APEVEGLVAVFHRAVRGEHRLPVGRVDEATPDLKLRDALDLVVLLRGQAARRPGLPVRGRDDERAQQDEGDECEAGDLAVHWLFARCETRSRPASSTKLATTDEPPYDTNGSVIPVNGITRSTPPTMMNVCSAKPNVRPAASSFEKPSSACSATFMPRATKSMKTSRSAAEPIRPISWASAE